MGRRFQDILAQGLVFPVLPYMTVNIEVVTRLYMSIVAKNDEETIYFTRNRQIDAL